MTTSNTFLLGGDLPINRLGYGAMRLAANGFSGPARDPETGREVLRQAVAAGVNHIDTADFYVSDDGALSANTLIREACTPTATTWSSRPRSAPSAPPEAGSR